ncbi:hypothetical protein [Acinetobacter sp. BY419]|uniref:hypothetical protein n=1 Tax=Acinetobacter sp. BY419 TaxID=2820675 RepID=UPI001C230D61|nr:hypothetical protein [Acinetobacter sp. BY419]
MYKSLFFIGLLSLNTLCFADSDFGKELRSGCDKVKTYANNGKKFYDQKQYLKALEQFKQQAAWSSFCAMNVEDGGTAFSERDITTAFNNVGLSYAKLGKPQWARAWFSVFPNAKASQFNLKQLPAPEKPKNLAGKYVRYAGFGQWNAIEVKRTSNAYQIEFNGLYMGLRSLIYGPNMGEFLTRMPLNKTHTQYRYDDCRIDLKFQFSAENGQQIVVNSSNPMSCGFGHNVSADGRYLKVE